jgi:glycosyltransferase involved in cell wall biosynthesis
LSRVAYGDHRNQTNDLRKVDVIVPVFNEMLCLPELTQRLLALSHSEGNRFQYRFIFVNDGSTDGSRETLNEYVAKYENLNCIHLSRNFGHQIAVSAGMDFAKADYVAIIDADLQDPPELIPAMVVLLERDNLDVVYGLRKKRFGESIFKRSSAKLFYRLIRVFSGLDIPLDTGDFRVMTQSANRKIAQLREQNRFLRGLAPWLGLKSAAFEYERLERYAGRTKYSMTRMFKLGANAVASFSVMPLRLIQVLGLFLSISGLIGTGVCLTIIVIGINLPLLLLIAFLNLSLLGAVLLSVGVVGGYVHRIQDEVRGRPLYVVEEVS